MRMLERLLSMYWMLQDGAAGAPHTCTHAGNGASGAPHAYLL